MPGENAMKNAKERAVIYARYSSHNQTEQSIEGQLAKGHEFAAARGYTVVHEYCDRAVSGRTDNREAFQRMLSDTSKHQFDVIIVWKVDRFGRNREEIAFNKHRCKANGVRVEYVAENLPDSPEAVILESVLEGMAEYYSLQLSQNVKRGQLESARKCQYVGGLMPLGYRADPETMRYVPDEKTAPIVRLIFDMYAKGAIEAEIIRHLNEHGYRTPRGKPYTKSALATVLHNEKYIGVYTYRAESETIRVEGGVPALIDKDTFDKVQELMKIHRRAPSSAWTKQDYILSDKLFCGHCGTRMVGESGFSHTGVKHSYYACQQKRKEHKCNKKSVRQDWIEGIVIEHVKSLLQDTELLELLADKAFEYYKASDDSAEQKALLESKLAEVEKSIANLVKAVEAGLFNEAMKTRMEELDQQKAEISAAIAELSLASKFQLTRDHILYFLLRFRDADLENREVQKRLIQTFINAIFLYDDGKIKIVHNFTGDNNIITLEAVNDAEAEAGDGTAQGFVHCTPCSAMPIRYKPGILIFGNVFMITITIETAS